MFECSSGGKIGRIVVGCGGWSLWPSILLAFALFANEPDLQDAIIYWLMKL